MLESVRISPIKAVQNDFSNCPLSRDTKVFLVSRSQPLHPLGRFPSGSVPLGHGSFPVISLLDIVPTLFNKAMNQLVNKKNFFPHPRLYSLFLASSSPSFPPVLFSPVPTSPSSIFTSCPRSSSFCYFSPPRPPFRRVSLSPVQSFSFAIHSPAHHGREGDCAERSD